MKKGRNIIGDIVTMGIPIVRYTACQTPGTKL